LKLYIIESPEKYREGQKHVYMMFYGTKNKRKKIIHSGLKCRKHHILYTLINTL
jgi:hypothetical protein